MMSSRRRCGFTLLEVVLAMAMTSMLALTLYTALRVCLIASRSAAGEMEEIRDADAAMDQLASDLSSALPPTGTLAGPFTGTANAGADQAEFYLMDVLPTANQSQSMPGVVRVNWELQGQTSALTLHRRAVRSLVTSIEPAAQDDTLCRNIRAISLRYYDGSTWRTDWDSTAEGDTLPTAVEITLEINRQTSSRMESIRRLSRIVRVACAPPSTTSSGGTP